MVHRWPVTPDNKGDETGNAGKAGAKEVALDDLLNDHISIPIAQCKHFIGITADASIMIEPLLLRNHYT